MLIKENVSLKPYTTFKIGGSAHYFLEAETAKEIIAAIKRAKKQGLAFFILGGGSNLLVSDRGFEGLAIKMKNDGKAVILSPSLSLRINSAKDLKQRDSSGGVYTEQSERALRMTQSEDKSMILKVEAGARLSDLVKLSLDEGLSGLEWAAGIPQATIGGAIWGNAGAFEKSMADVVSEVEAIETKNEKVKMKNENSKLKIFKNKDCGFRYKDSVFKQNKNLIILSAILVLQKKNKEEVKKKIKEIFEYRKEHHPIEPSAGSVFKNVRTKNEKEKIFLKFPEAKIFEAKGEIPAGWLIEKVGLKGIKIGGAEISPKHANFIINTGSAQAGDVVKLIKLAQQKVQEKFGIFLEEEIQCLGF